MINITVAGPEHSGKTTILALIHETLKNNGFNSITFVNAERTEIDYQEKLKTFKNNTADEIRKQDIQLIENNYNLFNGDLKLNRKSYFKTDKDFDASAR